ncbi:hypothetical protein SAMD00019534_061080 [Acytostelium subglobosum LB1]|uniref:hypothetical protein n=1 Tax=Acytostelium subglobosum LB1 TaxID=1410327 RepID=UPI0006450497|nr:hypothetical protein SAMD00019534_061080 [Acytostelium subglobosum LB1]GAM22933.1 hypothetical protein SAMD00019534_061080 [Acytostelium subglobosum LB1]|eukprot:XP_012754160.1 hypothetical protein SAMD00019534_061080 [Acytostelium subglobosum LB1]
MNINSGGGIPAPPPGWQISMDNMGRYFYYNPMTQQQSWTPPPGSQMPTAVVGQQQQQQQSGIGQGQPIVQQSPQQHINISNLANSKSSLSSSSLPDGWEEATDNQGRVYYIDHLNKKTSWIHPNFSQQLHHQQPQSQQQQSQPVHQQQQQQSHQQQQQQPIISSNPSYPSIVPKKAAPSSGDYYPSMNEYGYNVSSSPKQPTFIPPKVTSAPAPARPSTTTSPMAPIQRPPLSMSKPTSVLSQTAPLWDLEKIVPACSNCYLPFTVIRRRHHCRCCQREFCDACSVKRIAIPQFNHNDQVRVCLYCFIHTTDHEKTCISRLVPYFLDFHKDTNHQYQALCELYDFLLTNQNNAERVETALVGGLKPFMEYIARTTKENHRSENLTLACQIVCFLTKYKKLLKPLHQTEYISALFDLMSCTDVASVKLDCARILKNIISNIDKTTHTPTQPPAPSVAAAAAVTLNVGAVQNAAGVVEDGGLRVTTAISKAQIVEIVSLLENPTSKDDFQLELLKILRILSHNEEQLQNIANSNIVEVASPLLSSTRVDVLKSVLKVLTRLSILDKQNAEKLYSVGGVIFLLELLVKQISPVLNVILIKLLYSISKVSKCSSAIASSDTGIGSILFLFVNSSGNLNLQEPILLLLLQVMENNQLNKQMHIQITQNDSFIKSMFQSLKIPALEPLVLAIFSQLCLTDESKESLRVQGIIEPILSMMYDRSKSILLPLEILTRIAMNNEKACYDIFEVGGLSVLIDIITSPAPQAPKREAPVNGEIPYTELEDIAESTYNADVKRFEMYKKVQYNTVKLVGSLSYSKNIVQEFVHFENGAGVKALVALLNPSVDESVKQVASEALSNLCENETCAILVLSEEGLTYSMALLSSSNTAIKANALRLLQRLASHSQEIKLAISEGTSIRQIVEMLSNQSAELKKCAIFSLAELCKENESNREQAFKFGCLPILAQSFNIYTSDPKSLVCLLEIISGFAGQNDQYRSVLLGTSIVQSIIEYLFNNMNSPDDNFVIQTQVYSVLILSQLVKENMADQIRKIINSGVILSLVPLLSVKNSYLQEYTLIVLNVVSKNSSSELRESLMTSGPILESLSQLLNSKNEAILVNSLTLLIELSKSPECGGYLLSTNAITQVSELIISPNTPTRCKSLAIQLISSFFSNNTSNTNIWEVFTAKAGIPGLVALLSSTSVMAQITSANALSAIVVDGPGRARVVESGGLHALVNALSSSNINVSCAVLVTVLGLSLEDELCETIVNLGALNSLLTILANQEYMSNNINIDAKLYACETIFNLASNQQCRSMICDNRLITQLLDLLFVGTEAYKIVACKTLALLAADPATAKAVCEQGGIIGLVPLLSYESSDENTLMSVAIALTNLAQHIEMSKNQILTTTNDKGVTGVEIILAILAAKDGVRSSQSLKLQLLDLLQMCSSDGIFLAALESTEQGIPNLLSLLSASLSKLPTMASSPQVKPVNDNDPSPSKEVQNQLLIVFKTLSIIIAISPNPKIRNLLVQNNCLKQISLLMTPPPEVLVSIDMLSNSISLLDLPTKETQHQHISVEAIGDKDEVNLQCLNLIHKFSLSEFGKNEIRNSKLVPLVQRFLDSKIEEQVCTSLKILHNLAVSNLNRLEIHTNGGMEKVLDIFTKTTSPTIILNSLCTLYQLIYLVDNFNLFIKRDCFKLLAQCTAYPSEAIQLNALMLINRHLNNERYAEILNGLGIVDSILNILNTASSENLIMYVLKTLNDFTPFDNLRKTISEKLPIDVLKAMQTVPNQTIRELSESLLGSFGSN